jgi:UDPglucose 6-dehydrogenase
VKVYDPIAMPVCRQLYPELKIRYCESALETAQDSDALVVVTEWNEFRALPLAELAAAMAQPVLVDGRNLFSPEAAIAAGFDYTGMGRCPRPREPRREAEASPSVTT